MPTIYLSPSTQQANTYVTGGSEEYWMNLLADKMEPWLISTGIKYTRNTPEMTAGSSIRASNAGNYDFHLALHSNAAPEGRYGEVRGSIAFYAPNSIRGEKAAVLIAENLSTVYPFPEGARAQSTTSLGEVTRTRAPAVLVEVAYHDNVDDANWITENLDLIAEKLALSMAEYFGLPLVSPMTPKTGKVALKSGNLNIRNYPSTAGRVISSAPNGSVLTVLGSWNGWYTVNYNGTVGYASSDYIRLL
ncbi:MAG: SH3 domain-containing protein [Oscillospiraceae bacterium]|nr:SH3 domain-containing protein [Oscillospiraceae bacterium]